MTVVLSQPALLTVCSECYCSNVDFSFIWEKDDLVLVSGNR